MISCRTCGQRFTRQSSLNEHIRSGACIKRQALQVATARSSSRGLQQRSMGMQQHNAAAAAAPELGGRLVTDYSARIKELEDEVAGKETQVELVEKKAGLDKRLAMADPGFDLVDVGAAIIGAWLGVRLERQIRYGEGIKGIKGFKPKISIGL